MPNKFKRQQRQLRFLRARIGRLIRDIGRKYRRKPSSSGVSMALTRARQIPDPAHCEKLVER